MSAGQYAVTMEPDVRFIAEDSNDDDDASSYVDDKTQNKFSILTLTYLIKYGVIGMDQKVKLEQSEVAVLMPDTATRTTRNSSRKSSLEMRRKPLWTRSFDRENC